MKRGFYTHGFVHEYVNYWGLIEGRQIMFCKTRLNPGGFKLFLWCKKDTESEFELSEEGKSYLHNLQQFRESHYVADAEYIEFKHNNPKLWTYLYEEKLFPFWDPNGGPYAYFNRDPQASKFIVLYDVYRIKEPIRQEYIIRAFEYDVVKLHVGIYRRVYDVIQSTKVPINKEAHKYDNARKRIIEIVKEFGDLIYIWSDV